MLSKPYENLYLKVNISEYPIVMADPLSVKKLTIFKSPIVPIGMNNNGKVSTASAVPSTTPVYTAPMKSSHPFTGISQITPHTPTSGPATSTHTAITEMSPTSPIKSPNFSPTNSTPPTSPSPSPHTSTTPPTPISPTSPSAPSASHITTIPTNSLPPPTDISTSPKVSTAVTDQTDTAITTNCTSSPAPTATPAIANPTWSITPQASTNTSHLIAPTTSSITTITSAPASSSFMVITEALVTEFNLPQQIVVDSHMDEPMDHLELETVQVGPLLLMETNATVEIPNPRGKYLARFPSTVPQQLYWSGGGLFFWSRQLA